MTSDKTQKENGLSFKLIEPDLISLKRSIKTTIDQNTRKSLSDIHPGFPSLLIGVLRVAWETWQTIGFICSDKIEEKGGHLDFAVSVPPLTRTLADSVFMLVYIFDSPETRLKEYFESTWAKLTQDLIRLKNQYGNKNEWRDQLDEFTSFVDELNKIVSIRSSDPIELKKLSKLWPNPGGMIRAVSNQERKNFLQYLNDWFYVNLSQDSHLSGPGLIRRGGFFLDPPEEVKRKYRSNCVRQTLILLLALLSELAIDACKNDTTLKNNSAYLWGILKGYWEPAKDLWEKRYEQLLSITTR